MAALADTIELARRREQAQKWDQGEAALAAEVVLRAQLPPPPDLSEEDRQSLQPFIAYTTTASARFCPAKPTTVAAFIIEQAGATGSSTEKLLQQLDAIGRLHDRHNLANPCATHAARAALESVTNIEPPRSWRGPEKQMFTTLPAECRAVVARRERERELEVRKLQNETAQLRQSTAADTKAPSKLNGETANEEAR
jgi:hypothetical protein